MAPGKIHAITSAVAAGLSGPTLALLSDVPVWHAAAFSIGSALGILITPDLDIRHDIHADRVIQRSTGQVVARIWELFWWLYARLIPRHRHPLSHTPLLGTGLRLLYLFLFPMLIWQGLRFFLALPPYPSLPVTIPLLWGVAGLVFSDVLHLIMDWLWR
jgi:uncharacterized metal-binding protein